VREKQGPHDSRISQLRAKIVAKRVASQIKGQRDTRRFARTDGRDLPRLAARGGATGVDQSSRPTLADPRTGLDCRVA